MEIRDILIKEYDLITELEKSIPEAKTHIQYKFWKKLAEKITRDCRINVCNVCNATSEGRSFKVSRCEGEGFSSLDIALRVEDQPGAGVWYGFGLLENDSIVKKCKEEKFKKYVTLVRNVLKAKGPTDQTLGWKRLKYCNKTISFSDFGEKRMRYVVEDDELKKTVGKIAQEIKDAVDELIEAKKKAGL